MNKKRSNLDYSDVTFSDLLDNNIVARINAANVSCVLFSIWVVGLSMHFCYNIYVGHRSSVIHIETQRDWHELCLREPLVRETQFEKCHTARIEKDLSPAWTTVNYVLHHTNVCIVTSCYAVFLDMTANLGWLLIGVAFIGAFLLYISVRHNNSIPQIYLQGHTPMRQIQSDSNATNRRGQMEIVQIKND